MTIDRTSRVRPRGRQRGGWIAADVLMALAIVGGLAAALAAAVEHTGRLNKVCLTQQRCLAAAQAQLDSLAATGAALDDADLRRLWADVKLTVARRPGEGDWAGLELVKVTATAAAGGADVRVELSRYLPARKGGS